MDKDMIVFEGSRLDNLIRLLDRLVSQSKYEDYKNGYESDIKFELGSEIVSQLKIDCMHYFKDSFQNPLKKDERLMIMGIPVEVNRDVPDMIKLWKEVKV